MYILKRLIGALIIAGGIWGASQELKVSTCMSIAIIAMGAVVVMLNPNGEDFLSNWLIGRKNKPMFGADKEEQNS